MEAPLVTELLSRAETAELQLSGTLDGMSMGALLEMRRAVCAPIQTERSLRGIVFAGARNKQAGLEKSVVERLATELAIVAQVEDERRRARERQEDVVSASRILGSLASSAPMDALLASVADDCVKGSGSEFGLKAVFAVIGEIRFPGKEKSGEPATNVTGSAVPGAPDIGMEFLWRSGDPTWTSAMEREPILGLWRRALESRRAEGGEPDAGGSSKVARIMAFPLQSGEEPLGILVAGLRQKDVSLATLERLELRAAVATQALLARRRSLELEQQRNWTRALLQAGSEPLILVEPDGTIAKLNENARTLLGDSERFANSADAERHFADLFQARERTQIEAWFQAHRNGKASKVAGIEPLDCELATGAKVRLESIPAPGGEITAIRLSLIEGDNSEAAEERRAELELRNVIEWLDEGVVLFDDRQEVRVMNTRFAQMAGLTPQESTRTQNLHRLVARMANQTAEPDKFASRWLALAHGTESGVRDELQLLLPVPRVLERAARPVLDSEGGRLGRVEIYRDLTAQRVFHSTLIQTEKLAALGQMVTTIAHELSNPLTSILGYAQRLLAHNRENGPWHARQILHEAERASTILKQLLLTARNSRPERRKVQLNQIVARTLELQSPSLGLEKVHIELDLDPDLPLVLGDAGQLQQVLMNLIGNARQAIEQEGKAGTVRIRTRRAGGTHALLEVSDNGPGISEAVIAKIFDPFFTTKPAGIGTGLGLSIVLGIVREHGGQVRVTSPPGGGATFSIELPAVPSDERQLLPRGVDELDSEEDEASVESATAGQEAVLAPWAGRRVLVVEDEATVAQLIADVLKDEGLDVDVLLDGREALRQAATEAYDLVICDMKMPELDGEQFYRRLARTGNPLSRRVLFVTGDVLAAQTRQFLQRNALAHLAKPFRVEELTEKVRQVLTEISPLKLRVTKTKVARN